MLNGQIQAMKIRRQIFHGLAASSEGVERVCDQFL
jgi:hypothetical protein